MEIYKFSNHCEITEIQGWRGPKEIIQSNYLQQDQAGLPSP